MGEKAATARDDPKQRIIDATISCISEFGIQGTTTRRIADMAGANIAMVNYHFGSKEKLVDLAIRRSLSDYLSEFSGPAAEGGDLFDLLSRVLATVLDDAISRPRVMRSYLYDALLNEDYRGVFIEKLFSVLKGFEDGMGDGKTEKELRDTRIAIAQILAATLFVGLMPDFFRGFIDIDLRMKAGQEEFSISLMRHFADVFARGKKLAPKANPSASGPKSKKPRKGD